jgi:hypothetical protein
MLPLIDPYDGSSEEESPQLEPTFPHDVSDSESESDILDLIDREEAPSSEESLSTILMKAQARLQAAGHRERRGTIPGVKGTYSGTKVNGTSSRTSDWRKDKSKEKTDRGIAEADAQYAKSGGRPMLLSHYFSKSPLTARSDPPVDSRVDWEWDEGSEADNNDNNDEVEYIETRQVPPASKVSTNDKTTLSATNTDASPDHNDSDESHPDIIFIPTKAHTRSYMPPPTEHNALLALKTLESMLRPPRDKGQGYKDPKLDLLT